MRRAFALVLTIFVVHSILAAADGDVDFGFGFGGNVSTDFGVNDRLTDLAIQADGKIVAAGASCVPPVPVCSIILARYNSNGSPDAAFGNSGKVVAPLGGNEFTALAIQSDGKIIVVGQTGGPSSDFAVFRYNSNGVLDSTFGTGGRVITNIGGSDSARDVAIQPDGKIVVVGEGLSMTLADFTVVRYNPDGSLDSKFGVGGAVTTDFFSSDDTPTGVAIQPDGKIVVVGGACDVRCVFAVVRYEAIGNPDSNFGNEGIVISDLSVQTHTATSVGLQLDGKILVGGGGDEMLLRLVRYLPDGRLDPGFGFDGIASGNLPNASALAVQADGKILVSSSATSFSLARYRSDGLLDTTFGAGGQVTTVLPGGSAGAGSVAIQIDGKILAAGTMFTPSGSDFVVARYNGSAVPVTLRFDPTTVRIGGTFTAIFSGTNANTDTYFDIRFRSPGTMADLESFNWQFGSQQAHGVPVGTSTGIWTITGIRPHQNPNDHSGDFTPSSVNLIVVP